MMVEREKGIKGEKVPKKYLLKIFIEENVKRGNGVRLREKWELLEEGQLCKEGKNPF